MTNKFIFQTWADLKAKHPDAIILFRKGDFYRALQEDAAACARDLGITVRRNADTDRTQQASFPSHAETLPQSHYYRVMAEFRLSKTL